MMERKFRKSFIAALGILVIAFNMISFLIPGRAIHPVAFWTSDLFMIIAILFQFYVLRVALAKHSGLLSKVYGYPILQVGIRYIFLQFIASTVVIILCTLGILVPVWLIAGISLILLAYGTIGLIAADQARDVVENLETSFEQQTKNMHNIRSIVNSLQIYTEDPNMKSKLKELAEEVRYSDPVSSAASQEQEMILEEQAQLLMYALKEKSPEAIEIMDKFRKLLQERNETVKLHKRQDKKKGSIG